MTSELKVDKITPASGTSTQIGDSGDTITIPSGATLANAGSVTGLPASSISSGTIATARLGSGTASSSTFLRGDQTYAEPGGGFVRTGGSQTHTNASTYYIDDVMSDTYRIYRVVGVLRADNTSADIYFRFRGDSSNNLSTSKYIQATNSVAIQSGNSPSSVTGGENTSWNFNYAWIANDSWNDRSTDRYGVHLDWYVYRPDSNQFNACGVIVGSHSYWDYNGGAARFRVNNTSIQYDVSTTPNGFIFYPDSGNMSTIDINVYGMVAS